MKRNIGQNKGKPRLWIEGKALIDAGFGKGDKWSLVMVARGFDIVRDISGKRKIAGIPNRPIVDITGGGLGPIVGKASQVTLKIELGKIKVRVSE